MLHSVRSMQFVLSYPNGWEEGQIEEMRRAVVSAGLVANSPEALERVCFISEGKAILHFCLNRIPTLEGVRSLTILLSPCWNM